jgi:hypothetical protein
LGNSPLKLWHGFTGFEMDDAKAYLIKLLVENLKLPAAERPQSKGVIVGQGPRAR